MLCCCSLKNYSPLPLGKVEWRERSLLTVRPDAHVLLWNKYFELEEVRRLHEEDERHDSVGQSRNTKGSFVPRPAAQLLGTKQPFCLGCASDLILLRLFFQTRRREFPRQHPRFNPSTGALRLLVLLWTSLGFGDGLWLSLPMAVSQTISRVFTH